MNTTAEKKAKLKEKYGRSQEETLRCSEYAKKWWPKETSHRMRIADEVRNQIFLFDLPWDMEQTAEPVTFEGEIGLVLSARTGSGIYFPGEPSSVLDLSGTGVCHDWG